MKKLITGLLSMLLILVVNAQQNNFNQAPLTLPSPQAKDFIKYGDIPVNYSTGVPDITVPLYTVTSGKLQLPISISYNASGIKVTDIASTVGMGWSLSAGGCISRSVLGADDQENKDKPYVSTDDIDDALSDIRTLSGSSFTSAVQDFVINSQEIYNRLHETQSDRYFYSLPGKSGVFRIDFQTGEPKTIPYSPLKISLGTSNAGPYTIVDESGVIFNFNQQEWSGPNPGPGFYKTTYYLTKIQTPDANDEINIYYKEDQPVVQKIKSFQLVRNAAIPASGCCAYVPSTSQISDNSFDNESIPQIPDSITARDVTVLFQYAIDRPDPRKSRLVSMTVLNRFTREVIKVIEFDHSYFGRAAYNNRRLRLDALNIKGNDTEIIERYGFGYDTTHMPAYYINTAWNGDTYSEDYWGYYNGANSTNLIPIDLFNSSFTNDDKYGYGGNRNPNESLMQACILNKIDYPTGGKTIFEFEANKVNSGYSYLSGTGDQDYGGLRIKKISSYSDANATPIVKTYKYSAGFHTIIEPEMYVYTSKDILWYMNGNQPMAQLNNYWNICTDAFTPLTTGGNTPVIYGSVTEFYGSDVANIGKIEYEYDIANIPYYIYDPGILGNPRFNGQYLTDQGNYNPQLLQKTEFKYVNNQYTPVHKETYSYDYLHQGQFVTGIKLERQTPFVKTGAMAALTDVEAGCYIQISSDCLAWQQFFLTDYLYSNTVAVTDVPVLSEKGEFSFAPNGTDAVLKNTFYEYDLTSLNPVREYFINSQGNEINTYYKYPGDFSSIAPYNTMLTRNMISPIIEVSNYKGTTFLNSRKINYKAWHDNIIAPETVEGKTLSDPSEVRLRYYDYDAKGNVSSVSKEGDQLTSYLWDYKNVYPIAKVNADAASIAYTSFEADGKGNWTYSGNPGIDVAPPTGQYIYTLNGSNNITKSGLNSASTYIISYWTKNNTPFSITGTVSGYPIAGRTFNGWKYFEHKISGQTLVTLTGTGAIDELRLYPASSQMMTYTYNPLKGIQAECDVNNRITYYEYDNFSRLKLIRDQDGNILKTFTYKYKEQQ